MFQATKELKSSKEIQVFRQFVNAGYDNRFVWWESIVMIRKFLVVATVVYLRRVGIRVQVSVGGEQSVDECTIMQTLPHMHLLLVNLMPGCATH